MLNSEIYVLLMVCFHNGNLIILGKKRNKTYIRSHAFVLLVFKLLTF